MTPNPIVDEERVARLVPLDAIDPDPDQPRKTFPGDALQELAQRIWEQGLIQPITASPGEDGRFKIFTGERRWRAFQINRERAARFFAGNPEDLPEDHLALRYGRWTSIPLLEAPALTPSDRILLQVAENHDREDLTLYERAVAIYKSFQLSGLKGKDFAAKAGIPAGVLSAYKGLAQSSGLTKLALENGVLQDPKAAVFFQQLSFDLQESLLQQAQEDETTLTRVQLRRELDALEAAKESAQRAAATPPAPAAGATRGGESGGEKSPPRVEPGGSPGLSEGPFLSVDGLLWLQTHLEGCEAAAGEGEEEPLRLEAVEATRKAVLTSAPFILIRESLGEPRSPLETSANRKLVEAV
jgi:ParB-like chromosome segregation protein Spo0J